MEYAATFTFDEDECLYYFKPSKRIDPPYHRQQRVEAIVDIAVDGTLAGVEIIGLTATPLPQK